MAVGGGGGGSSGAVRAGRAFVEFFLDDSKLTRGLGRLRSRFSSLSRSLAIGGGALTGVGAGGLFGLGKVTDTLADMGRMKDAADALGMSIEGASGLFGVLAANGGDFKEDLEGITQFGQRLQDALKGVGGPTGEAARLFDGLSVSAQDLAGVPLDEAFFRVLGAVRELPQHMQATRLGLMGGTDSMKKWLPLLARSTDEIREQSRALRMSDEDLAAAKDATLAYRRATTTLTQAWRQVAVALAPTIQQIADGFTSVMGPVGQFIKDNRQVVVAVAATVAGVAAGGVALLGLSGVFLGLNAAVWLVTGTLGLLSSAVGLLLSPLGLVGVGVAAAALSGHLGKVRVEWAQLGDAFDGMGSRIKNAIQGIKDALSAGDLTLAVKIMTAAMKVEMVKFVNVLKKGFEQVVHDFENSLSPEKLKRIALNISQVLQISFNPFLSKEERQAHLAEEERAFRKKMAELGSKQRRSPFTTTDPFTGEEVFTQDYIDRFLVPEGKAQGELEGLLAQAKQAALMARVRRAFRDAFGGPAGGAAPKLPPGITAGAPTDLVTAGGAFGASVGGRQSARSSDDLARKQLRQQEMIAENTQAVADFLAKGGAVLAWAP